MADTYTVVGLDGLNATLCRPRLLEIWRRLVVRGFAIRNVAERGVPHHNLRRFRRDLHGPLDFLPAKACKVCGCHRHGRLMGCIPKGPLGLASLEGTIALKFAPIAGLVLADVLEHCFR